MQLLHNVGIKDKTLSIYSQKMLSVIEDIRSFTPDILFKFCQAMQVLRLNPSYVVLAFADVSIPESIFIQDQAALAQQSAVSKSEKVHGKIAPIPIKGNQQSMKDWIAYVITEERNFHLINPYIMG